MPAAQADPCVMAVHASVGTSISSARIASRTFGRAAIRFHIAPYIRVMSHVDAPKLRAADNGEAVGVGHREAIAHEERLPELAVSLWLITHPDLRKTARRLIPDAPATRNLVTEPGWLM